MMNSKIVVAGAAFCALMGLGAAETPKKPVSEMTAEERAARKEAVKEAFLKKTGGFLSIPGTQKGAIAFVNTQTALDKTNVTHIVDVLCTKSRFNARYLEMPDGDMDAIQGKAKADVVVVVGDNDRDPALLVAPEERWARVNVRKLAAGLKSENAREKFWASRCRKEVLRAFALVGGGASSQFTGNIMTVREIPELDMCGEFLPGDTNGKVNVFLQSIGVTPAGRTTYHRACLEGWAPAPTNDIQRAVWQRSQEEKERGPTKPIKIVPPNAKK